MRTYIFLLFLLSGLFFFSGCRKQVKIRQVKIGTGGVTGVYFPAGGAISTLINKKPDIYHIKMTVESTPGSVYNINSVLNGKLDIGLAQSDSQYQAWHGTRKWKEKGPQKNLRSLFSIHSEPVTLITTGKSHIKKVIDLKGKKVNLGEPGSGPLQNARDIIKAEGLSEKDIHAKFKPAVDAPKLLMDEEIDAFFYTVGQPNSNIEETASGKFKIYIVPIDGPNIDRLVGNMPYYVKSFILRKYYPNILNSTDIPSISVKSTVVASKDCDPEIVYAVTKVVFNNLKQFKELHPAFKSITKKKMLQGLTAPIHEGALRFYRESELIQYIDLKAGFARNPKESTLTINVN